MFKNVISPIQAWLMSQGKCVADGKPLKGSKRVKSPNNTYKVTHSCGRIYIYNPKTKKYRRALLEEV